MQGYKKQYKNAKRSTLAGLRKSPKNTGVIVEDIIHMTKDDERQLRTSLNYDAHHKNQKLFCVSHAIHKTSMFSMLPFFHFIIFTCFPANLPLLRFTFSYYKLEPEQKALWIDEFKRLCGNGQLNAYFFFDTATMSFYHTTDILSPESANFIGTLGNMIETNNETNNEAEKKKLSKQFDKFVDSLVFKSEASAVFSIIINSINLTLIRAADLTVCFNSISGKRTRISLVDYVTCILSPSAKASKSLLVLHKYLRHACLIPYIFIKNKNFSCY